MRYSVFLCDYEAFLEEVGPLIISADSGDFDPAIKRAREIRRDVLPGEWILEGSGAGITSIDNAEIPALVGYSFFVILGNYVQPYSFNRRLNIDIRSSLPNLGWSETDMQMLTIGMSLTYLLKPENVADPMQRPSAEDPGWKKPSNYHWWFRPSHSYEVGWVDIANVERLHEKIKQDKTTILSSKEWLEKETGTSDLALSQYLEIISLLYSQALRDKTGLLMSLSY